METGNDRIITKVEGLCPVTRNNTVFLLVPHQQVGMYYMMHIEHLILYTFKFPK